MTDAERVVAAYRGWYAATEWREVGDSPEWGELVRVVRRAGGADLVDAVQASAGDLVAVTVARILARSEDDVTLMSRALLEAIRAEDATRPD